ncbi:MAG: DUF421 domain-containing protein [Oscillospiraceae bacterium]|nr:DUF421 domain-containing protein [Oscillospiraceae bacterium]
MIIIFIRTLIVYFSLLVFLRLLGKRQLGEMELSEFIVASMIADLASNPLQDIGIPLLNGLIPIVTLFCCELAISTLTMCSIRLRAFLFGKPSLLIDHGRILQKEMRRNRFTLDELLSELRALGVRDIATIEYAFLETNGKLSVLQYESETPPSAAALNVSVENCGFPRILISDGRLIRENLRKSGYEETWLMKQIRPYGGKISEIFLLTVDDAARVYCVRKEKKA